MSRSWAGFIAQLRFRPERGPGRLLTGADAAQLPRPLGHSKSAIQYHIISYHIISYYIIGHIMIFCIFQRHIIPCNLNMIHLCILCRIGVLLQNLGVLLFGSSQRSGCTTWTGKRLAAQRTSDGANNLRTSFPILLDQNALEFEEMT